MWHKGQFYTIPKYIKNEIEKKNIRFPLEQQKMESPKQLAQVLGWTRYFRRKHTIKLYKNKKDCY